MGTAESERVIDLINGAYIKNIQELDVDGFARWVEPSAYVFPEGAFDEFMKMISKLTPEGRPFKSIADIPAPRLKHIVRRTKMLNEAVLEENWSMVEVYADDLKHLVEDHKSDLREMVAQAWIEGNRQGWQQNTDWPQDGYRYFDEKYT